MASSHTQSKDEELNLQLQSASNYDGSDNNHWKCRSNCNLENENKDKNSSQGGDSFKGGVSTKNRVFTQEAIEREHILLREDIMVLKNNMSNVYYNQRILLSF